VTIAVGTGSYVDPSCAKVTVGTMAEPWFSAKINLRTTTRPLQKRAEGPCVARLGRRPRRRLLVVTPTLKAAQAASAKLCIEPHPGVAGLSARLADLLFRCNGYM
jgi:hypothetical protein